jgi:hypothetical protein
MIQLQIQHHHHMTPHFLRTQGHFHVQLTTQVHHKLTNYTHPKWVLEWVKGKALWLVAVWALVWVLVLAFQYNALPLHLEFDIQQHHHNIEHKQQLTVSRQYNHQCLRNHSQHLPMIPQQQNRQFQ